MDSVVIYRDYGEVKLNIKKIMDKKGITINQVVKNTGLHHQVVRRYYDGTIVRYDKDVLSKLCFVLDCDLDDIMYYEKPKKK